MMIWFFLFPFRFLRVAQRTSQVCRWFPLQILVGVFSVWGETRPVLLLSCPDIRYVHNSVRKPAFLWLLTVQCTFRFTLLIKLQVFRYSCTYENACLLYICMKKQEKTVKRIQKNYYLYYDLTYLLKYEHKWILDTCLRPEHDQVNIR